MTEQQKNIFDSISKWGDFVTPFGIVLLLILQAQFVSRKEFSETTEKMGIRVEAIEKILVQMAEANKVNDRQDVQLSDHERRIRDLEHSHQ